MCVFFWLLFPLNVWAKNPGKWVENKIDRVLNHQQILLLDGRVIALAGIEMPALYHPDRSKSCYNRQIFRALKILLEGSKVRIFEPSDSLNFDRFRHIKLSDKRLLSEVLLRRGMGVLDPTYTKSEKFFARYKKASEEAAFLSLGVWNGCDHQKKYQEMRFLKGKNFEFYEKYQTYLGNISTGWVREVLTGNTIRLKNNLEVKLIGVSVPSVDSDQPVLACFAQQSQKYLESFLLGKKVFLIKDESQRDPDGYLLRYVYIPQNKYQNEVFLNQKIIEDGYGKFISEKSSFSGLKDHRFDKILERVQSQTYKNPKGAWDFCLKHFETKAQKKETVKLEALKKKEKMKAKKLAEKLAKKKEKERQKSIKKAQKLLEKLEKEALKKLEYEKNHPLDPYCPIKGNVSGSKKNPIKKYHTRYSGWYKNLKYERCFEDEDAAEKSGFVRVK